MKLQFIPVDYDNFDYNDRNYAKIVGRTSEGKRVCIIDTCDIYTWVILKDNLSDKQTKKLINRISAVEVKSANRTTKVEKIELHDKRFLEKPVKALKLFITNYKDAQAIADQLGKGFPEIEKRREHDLNFITKYIIEKQLIPLNWHEIEFSDDSILNNSEKFGGIDSALDLDFCIDLTEGTIKPLDKNEFTPKVLAFDIETDAFQVGKGKILMIAVVSDKVKKVITWKKTKTKLDYVEFVKDEADLIERFVETVKSVSPDFITGYFSDNFDMPYLKARAEVNKVKLSLGLDDSQPKFSRGITTVARTSGITHIDLYKFIRTAYAQYLESETLSLNDVAQALLKDNKKEFDIAKHLNPSNSYENWGAFFEYNLYDADITHRLFKESWQDLMEFTRVMREPIFEVSRNGMSKNVESFIIHNLARFNEIVEKRPSHSELGERREREKYEGAFVLQPQAGLYENLAMFDFTSYWPSIIVSFNLSKSTYHERKQKDDLEVKASSKSGKRFYFSKTPGFFPTLLKEIIKLRKQYKAELRTKEDPFKRARSNAFKVLANSAYGYQGFFGARYYCPEAAASTTAISREYIQDIIKKIDKEGFKTIYSDTDSICILLNNKPKKDALDFISQINKTLPGIMELELEDFYKRGLWVTTRSGEFGAKKKYAQLSESGKLKVRGFETVRRDWCKLARVFQNKIIQMVLEDGNSERALEYTKKIIKQIKERKISIDELIIKTGLKKPLSEYKAITPHVIAARKMRELGLQVGLGTLIEYYVADTISDKKKQLVRDRVKLPSEKGEYDISYYLENQILPAVENIFQVFKINTNELIDGKKQMKLGEF